MFSETESHSTKVGLPPGTVKYLGHKKTRKIFFELIEFDSKKVIEQEYDSFSSIKEFDDKKKYWLRVSGIHDDKLLKKIGKRFDINPLVLEDIVTNTQRPKIDDYGKYLYVVFKTIYFKKSDIISEQISLIIFKNFIISFQESERNIFEAVKNRLNNKKSKMRKLGPDYLSYAIVDATVDNYYLILEEIGENIEFIEKEITLNPKTELLNKIYKLKRQMIFLRKTIWPLREMMNLMSRNESGLIKKSTNIYLRDLYDHVIQVIDTVETYRDLLSGMHDIYLSSVSNKLNEIMKVLTMIATIFIPLTFIAGVYGMNFRHMPELDVWWAYPVVMLFMLLVVVLMLLFFKRKNWF